MLILLKRLGQFFSKIEKSWRKVHFIDLKIIFNWKDAKKKGVPSKRDSVEDGASVSFSKLNLKGVFFRTKQFAQSFVLHRRKRRSLHHVYDQRD